MIAAAGPIHPASDESLGELLSDATLTFKSEAALVCLDRKREQLRLSYAEFRAEAMAMAQKLASLGVGAGTRVAIIMSNQPRWLVTAAAVFFRGGVLVPLDYKLTGFTGGAMMMAPDADPSDGALDIVRMGPLSRGQLLASFVRVSRGASRRASQPSVEEAGAVVLPAPSALDRVVSLGLWGAGVSWLMPRLTGMTLLHKLLPGRELEPLNRLYCWGQVKLL